MSKAVKGSIVVLVVLLAISIIAAVFTLLQNEALKRQNQALQNEVADYEASEKSLIKQAKELKDQNAGLTTQVDGLSREKADIDKEYRALKRKFDSVEGQIDRLSSEKRDWEQRVERMTKERDELMQKLRNQPEKIVEKIVYRDRPVEQNPDEVKPTPATPPPQRVQAPMPNSGELNEYVKTAAKEAASEDYWAGILRQKAALEVELGKLKSDLDEASLEVVNLKNNNNSLQLEIARLQNEREDILREIKQGEDLSNNLSLELARARNEQRYTEELADKIKTQNAKLSTQVKELTNTKLALEKSITQLSTDKNKLERKLLETENVIQGRIDEIWQLKETLDRRISVMPTRVNNREVELAPIIVNAANQAQATQQVAQTPLSVQPTSLSGSTIISVNEENNFVIVDRGASAGAKVGNRLTVYRGPTQIATLEIIQVREDISAADIRTKTAQLKVGDSVR